MYVFGGHAATSYLNDLLVLDLGISFSYYVEFVLIHSQTLMFGRRLRARGKYLPLDGSILWSCTEDN